MESTIERLTPYLKEIFQHLHKYPEISWEEHQTTAFIASLLAKYDCRITTFEDSTGLVADVGNGKPIIAIRADMDALWQEVDGEFRANHSCGHDAHMTIAIGVFMALLENGIPEKGTFRFIFQPAEEKGTGALQLVDKGVVDDADFLYGMHLRPVEELKNGQFAPAIQHGAAKFIKGSIKGDDAHGARPHLNANAIQIGTEFFQHLNNMQVDPRVSHSVKMTAFQAGGKSPNIIPGNAAFSIDVRAQTNEVIQLLTEKIERIAQMLAAYHQVTIDLEVGANVAASVLDGDAVNVMREAIIESAGEANSTQVITTTGGDDFHFYTIKHPEIKATMLAIGCDLKPGLHHPHMTFDHEVIPKAVEIMTHALKKTVELYS